MNWLGNLVQVEISKEDNVLSLGCGVLQEIEGLNCKKFVGIDIYEPYVNKLKEKGYNVHLGDITNKDNSLYKEKWDCVLILDVLEHLEHKDAIELLKFVKTIVNKKIIIYTPIKFYDNVNTGFKGNKVDVLNFLESDDSSPYKGLGINKYQGHKCLLTEEELRELGFITSTNNIDHNIYGVYYKEKDKKVTIAIPVYNDENYIKESIDSALNQSYKDIEVLVIDDFSTDKTYDILLSYGDKIKLFRNESNKGIGFNRNECIRKATGNFLCFLSSDDIMNKDFVSTRIKHNPQGLFSFANYNIIDEKGEIVYKLDIDLQDYCIEEIKVKSWLNAVNYTMFCNYSTVYASLDFWKEHMFDESYRRCEDLEHFLRLLFLDEETFLILTDYNVNYRVFPNMGTERIKSEIPLLDEKILKSISERINENYNTKLGKK